MDMKRAPIAPMDGETTYEGPKRAQTMYEALMRVTDVPNHLSRSEEVREVSWLVFSIFMILCSEFLH